MAEENVGAHRGVKDTLLVTVKVERRMKTKERKVVLLDIVAEAKA